MSTRPAAAAADPGRPLSVLVVDDDFRVAGLHADVVAQTPGCAVAGTAHSAGAALALLERAESPVDLALVDLYLAHQRQQPPARHRAQGEGRA
ncbi:hypothetical protein ABZ651_28130, partial [Streptomyces sp. NPDC007070]